MKKLPIEIWILISKYLNNYQDIKILLTSNLCNSSKQLETFIIPYFFYTLQLNHNNYNIPYTLSNLKGIFNSLSFQCDLQNCKFIINYLESQSNILLRFNYYNYLLNYITKIDTQNGHTYEFYPQYLTFENYDIISQTIINTTLARKLLGYKQLNLKNTKSVHILEECVYENLKTIVLYKFNRHNDNIVAYNYNEIKRVFSIYTPRFLAQILDNENILINKHIKVYNPYTKQNIQISSKEYIYLMRTLYNYNKELYHKYSDYIEIKRMKLYLLYFK